jgi:hypothetical protein
LFLCQNETIYVGNLISMTSGPDIMLIIFI